MPRTVISVENLSKHYQLGVIGTGTFRGDLERWWAKQRGEADPYLKVGEPDLGNRDGETIWALKDVNLAVTQGEALGIIGKNGAGKSTLLKILSRVAAPTSGVVKVRGRISSLLEVGTGFHPELTGRQNIYLNGAIMGMSKPDICRKFDEIVDFAGVERFIDTPVKRYSSGMYVRLGFSVAAHLEPDILVVDEVLAVGDMEFQNRCLGKMDDAMREEGRTILFVSHNMGAVNRLCTRAVLLDGGKAVMEGNTADVIAHYYNEVYSDDLGNDYVPSSSGRIQFHKVYFENEFGEQIRSATSFQTLRVVFEYSRSTSVSLPEMLLNFTFINDHGNRLFTCPMIIEAGRASELPVRGRLTCTIPNLPLSQGTYQIMFSCKLKGLADDKATGYSLITVATDPDWTSHRESYPTGYKDQMYGSFVVEYDWNVGEIRFQAEA